MGSIDLLSGEQPKKTVLAQMMETTVATVSFSVAALFPGLGATEPLGGASYPTQLETVSASDAKRKQPIDGVSPLDAEQIASSRPAPAPAPASATSFGASSDGQIILATSEATGSSYRDTHRALMATLGVADKFSKILSQGQSFLAVPDEVGVIKGHAVDEDTTVLMVRVARASAPSLIERFSSAISGTPSPDVATANRDELSVPAGVPVGKTYEAKDFNEFLSSVRVVSDLPGTNDAVVIRRLPKDQTEGYLADFDRMEGKRVIAGWLNGEGEDIVRKPPEYRGHKTVGETRGRPKSATFFGTHYQKLAEIGALQQADLKALDWPLYYSYETILRREVPPRPLSSLFS